ncbi:ATAD3A_B [Lepeophtheirus salmonis]|uniref:ATAD3A_B n=1 Tax=Lepeophtheirus salmonis TaxID=72036 RepID=A0A7R8HEE5_LEPSM|nr:ATAD3A_B [Lepeophtheirus salmonis]CAF3043224.1 ATAD3A_B [Lepeophtheirus salmonis]
MSWLFGSRGNAPEVPVSVDPPPASSDGGGKEGHRSEAYSFDSTALERAAKAAKELEKSKFSTQALELSKMQEETKQKEQMVKIKEYEVAVEQVKVEGKKVEADNRQKMLQEEAKIAKHKAEYQDQLAQEESVAKQEAMRKATLEHEMEMRAKADQKRIASEMDARGKMERDNQDLYLEQIRLKATESRSTIMEGIQTAGSVLGAVYTSKRATGVAASYIQARLGKPSLVRDTSRFSAFEFAKHPISFWKKRWANKSTDALTGVVLNPNLEARLRDVAIATKNTKLNQGMFLIWTTPYLRGGDISPMGRDGVTAIHKVFDWAETSRKAAGEGPKRGRKLKVEEMDYGALCSEIASITKGMSGREIAKLGIAWQASGYASEDGVLSRKMIMENVQDALKSHKQKIRWLSEEESRENSEVSLTTLTLSQI